MNAPGFWLLAVEEYLAYRRGLGFALQIEGGQLRRFAQFAGQADTDNRLTLTLAENWARDTAAPNPLTWARRIEVLRGFAKFLKRHDPGTEIPPSGLFGPAHRHRVPHIFSDDELAGLLAAARQLPPPGGLRPSTCRAVLGVLASTGLRIGEAVRLTRADVDLDKGLLAIRESKRHRCRWVPVHETVRVELRAYAEQRDHAVQSPKSDRFFLLDNGLSVNDRQIRYAFRCLLRHLGWTPRGDYALHRLHDLRHTFIVRNLLRSSRQGITPACAALALSTYVGHARVADTFWYATGIPDLMAIAGDRFHGYATEGTR